MSNKKDERDIDEILASIDAMLAEQDDSTTVTDERKETVEQAARSSEDALGLSSSADEKIDTHSKLQPFEPLDEALGEPEKAAPAEDDVEQKEESFEEDADVSEPRQRIVLTEEYLEPSAQESLPLWAAQANTDQDEPESTPDETTGETTDDEQSDDIETPQSDDLVEALSQGDELSDSIGDLDDFDLPELNDTAEEQTPENEAVAPNEEVETIEVEEEEETTDTETKAEAEESSNEKAEKSDEFNAVFNAIAHDDTITFDIGEAMDEDTVYDIEVLDKELVEAFVHNVVEEDDANRAEEAEKENTEEEEEANDEQASVEILEDAADDDSLDNLEDDLDDNPVDNLDEDLEDDLDDNLVDDLDNDFEDAFEDKMGSPEQAEEETSPSLEASVAEAVSNSVNSDETISLNPDELDPLIELISDDVRIKINQHLQQILPELISDALLEHLANQRDED